MSGRLISTSVTFEFHKWNFPSAHKPNSQKQRENPSRQKLRNVDFQDYKRISGNSKCEDKPVQKFFSKVHQERQFSLERKS